MKNIENNHPSEINSENVKQTKKAGLKTHRLILFFFLLLSITFMTSCWWGIERRGREGHDGRGRQGEHHGGGDHGGERHDH